MLNLADLKKELRHDNCLSSFLYIYRYWKVKLSEKSNCI